MTQLYRAVATGDMSGPPERGAILSLTLTNTSGAGATVTVTDDGSLNLGIHLAADGTEQMTFSGVDYRGDLSLAGDSGATVITWVEIA